METVNEKYNKVITILKKSKPDLGSTGNIEKEVINRISMSAYSGLSISTVVDFLFGWVYISWVRRSLVTASVILVLVFVYQQGIILKQISFLSSQIVRTDGETSSTPVDLIGKRLIMYKLTNRKIPTENITISEDQIEQLLDSVEELQGQYKDLLNMIEEDPALKKIIEKKMNEKNSKKIKL